MFFVSISTESSVLLPFFAALILLAPKSDLRLRPIVPTGVIHIER